MKLKNNIILIIILIVALFIRIYKISQYPVSLNWDEVSHGYNAYSLIETGKDQWDKSWPIFNFRAYGDYPTTLNMYLTVPFVYLFGLNEFTTRIVSVLCGFGIVYLTYLLSKLLFKNNSVINLITLISAVSPWTFFTSRATFQSTVAQFFLILGIYFLLKTIKQNIKYLLPALFFTSISTYAYHNTRIVIPLILFAFLIIYFKEIKKIFIKNKLYSTFSIIIFLLIFIPQFINMFDKEAQARSRWVFIINPASINLIEVSRNEFKGSPFLAKILYNKPLHFTKTVLNNYLGFINPKILFFNSTQNYQFNIPKNGVMFPIVLPFFYIGLFFLFKEIKNKDYQFLLLWYILGLIPAVITSGDFPIIRAMTILPIPYILIGIAFNKLIIFDKKNIFTIAIFSLVLFYSAIYLNNYFKKYSIQYSQSWQYGYKQAINYIKNNYDNYDQILITKKYGEAHEYLLFYYPWSPSKYLSDKNLKWDYHADWYWVDGFDKFTFINDWEIKEKTNDVNNKTLLITTQNNYNQNAKLLETINFLDNTVAFEILELNNEK